MKHILRLALLVFMVSKLQAQIPMVFYYNHEWRLTTKEEAVYYRECSYDTATQYLDGKVQDFTIDGKLYMTGFYKDKAKEGVFTFFWPNEKVKETGAFKNNIRVGIWKAFYPTGTPRHEIDFTPPGNIIFFNDSTGNKLLSNGTGFWMEEYTEGKVSIINEGNCVNGKPEGKWTSRFQDSTLIYTEHYNRKGELIKGIMNQTHKVYYAPIKNHMLIPYSLETTESFFLSFKSPNKPVIQETRKDSVAIGNQVFYIVEEPAHPVGGMAAFYKQISMLIRYPMEARRKGVEGRVFVEFVVEIDGSLSEVKVIRGIGGGCDEEAIRVVMQSDKWVPGKQRGKPVRSRFNLAIIFKLSNAKFKP